MCVLLFCRDQQQQQQQQDDAWRTAVSHAGLIDIHAIAIDKYHIDLTNLLMQSRAMTENLIHSENFLSADFNAAREALSTFGVLSTDVAT